MLPSASDATGRESREFQGVFGHSEQNAGVVGESSQFDGVFGVSHSSKSAGVSGHNDQGGVAGFFDGKVTVVGSLTGTPRPCGPRQTRAARLPSRAEAEIEIATPRRVELVEALTMLTKITPAVALTYDGATAFICRNRTIMFLLGDMGERGLDLAEVLRTKMQISAVAGRAETELLHWSLMYHVLTEPIGPHSVGIKMTSAKGRVMLEGTARVDGQRAFVRDSFHCPTGRARDRRRSFVRRGLHHVQECSRLICSDRRR